LEHIQGRRLIWQLEGNNGALASGQIQPGDIDQGEVKFLGKCTITTPRVLGPAGIKLVAELEGSGITNTWKLWTFPQEIRPFWAGKGIAASTSICAALRGRYHLLNWIGNSVSSPPGTEESLGLRIPVSEGPPELPAEGMQLLLADALDDTATRWLEAGKTVLLLKLPGIAPGVDLGWWTIGPQTGTAIAKHPAFGDFPHDGFVNELWFRLLGHTVSAEDPAYRNVEPLMVGRGSKGYLIHVFQAKANKGKLLASGLDLLSNNPESVWLLDQFIRYARSSDFQPGGNFDPRNTLNTRNGK
jgi:hypothetical protein